MTMTMNMTVFMTMTMTVFMNMTMTMIMTMTTMTTMTMTSVVEPELPFLAGAVKKGAAPAQGPAMTPCLKKR